MSAVMCNVSKLAKGPGWHRVCGVMIALGMSVVLSANSSAQNLLANAGFETGDTTGWSAFGGFDASGAPTVGAQEGAFALKLTVPGDNVSGVEQGSFDGGSPIPASAGDEFNLSGYMLTEQDLTTGGFTAGILKIVFEDAAGVDLVPASVSIGQLNTTDPGAEALPFLDASTPLNTWVFAETQAVAPAGTASVQFLALNVAFGSGETSMWFDNISATQVPEPASVTVLGLAVGALFVGLRKTRGAM